MVGESKGSSPPGNIRRVTSSYKNLSRRQMARRRRPAQHRHGAGSL